MSAVADTHGIQSDLIPGIATSLCSGFSETGGTCGALTGAALAVSMVEGRRMDKQARKPIYAKTKILVHRFRDEFQHTNCPELLQIQLGTPEASAEYQSRGLSQQCHRYIWEMTRLAIELIQES